jgi:hypothetical protein
VNIKESRRLTVATKVMGEDPDERRQKTSSGRRPTVFDAVSGGYQEVSLLI